MLAHPRALFSTNTGLYFSQYIWMVTLEKDLYTEHTVIYHDEYLKPVCIRFWRMDASSVSSTHWYISYRPLLIFWIELLGELSLLCFFLSFTYTLCRSTLRFYDSHFQANFFCWGSFLFCVPCVYMKSHIQVLWLTSPSHFFCWGSFLFCRSLYICSPHETFSISQM